MSRRGQEHVNQAYLEAQSENQKGRTELASEAIAELAREQDVSALAHELWRGRGCPEGSPEEDWFRAEKLRPGH